MATGDLVLTPEGLLAVVEEEGKEQVRVKYANHETYGLYPKGTALSLVARRADLEKARREPAPAAKEG